MASNCEAHCQRSAGHEGDCLVDMSAGELDAYLTWPPEQLDMYAEAAKHEAFRRWWCRRGGCSCAGVWWVLDCECQTAGIPRGVAA